MQAMEEAETKNSVLESNIDVCQIKKNIPNLEISSRYNWEDNAF